MSPQGSYYQSPGIRRPDSRLSPRRESIEKKEERKLRARKLWKIQQERERLHEERKKRFIKEYNENKHLMKDQHRRRRSGSRNEGEPRPNSDPRADTPPPEGVIQLAGYLHRILSRGEGSSRGTAPNLGSNEAAPIPGTSGRSGSHRDRYRGGEGSSRGTAPNLRSNEAPPIPGTSGHSGSSRDRHRRGDESPRRPRSRERAIKASPTSETRSRDRSPRPLSSRGGRDRTRSRSRDRRRPRSPRPHPDRHGPLRDNCACRWCQSCGRHGCNISHGRSTSRPRPPRTDGPARETVQPPRQERPRSPEILRPIWLPAPRPGRTYIFFPLGPLGSHYIDTQRDGPLYYWWREQFRVTSDAPDAPIDIPFLRTSHTIPPGPRPLPLEDENWWWPAPRPSRNPRYDGGPARPRPPPPPPPRYM